MVQGLVYKKNNVCLNNYIISFEYISSRKLSNSCPTYKIVYARGQQRTFESYPTQEVTSATRRIHNGFRVAVSRWRHHMEAFSTLLALCVGNSPVTGKFPSHKGPVIRTWCYFDVNPHNKHSNGWWFEITWRSSHIIVVFCFRHATPSHHHHHQQQQQQQQQVELLTAMKNLETSVGACWVYSVESVY